MNLFKTKKKLKIDTSLEDISNDSVTLVTKQKSETKGTYRVYVNGWKYNLQGYPILEEDKLKIDSTYFAKGLNRIQVVTKDKSGNRKTYEEEFINEN